MQKVAFDHIVHVGKNRRQRFEDLTGQYRMVLGQGFKCHHGTQSHRPARVDQQVDEGRKNHSPFGHHPCHSLGVAVFDHAFQGLGAQAGRIPVQHQGDQFTGIHGARPAEPIVQDDRGRGTDAIILGGVGEQLPVDHRQSDLVAAGGQAQQGGHGGGTEGAVGGNVNPDYRRCPQLCQSRSAHPL